MSVSLDTTATPQTVVGNGSNTSNSTSITPTSAASTIWLAVSIDTNYGVGVSGTPTCGGSAMTQAGSSLLTGSGQTLKVWRLENQPASAKTVAWNLSAGGTSTDSPWIAHIWVTNGSSTTNAVNATTGTAGYDQETGTQTSSTGNGVVAINMGSYATGDPAAAATVNVGTIYGRNHTSITGGTLFSLMSYVTGSASVTVTYTLGANPDRNLAFFTIDIAAAGSSIHALPPFLMTVL